MNRAMDMPARELRLLIPARIHDRKEADHHSKCVSKSGVEIHAPWIYWCHAFGEICSVLVYFLRLAGGDELRSG